MTVIAFTIGAALGLGVTLIAYGLGWFGRAGFWAGFFLGNAFLLVAHISAGDTVMACFSSVAAAICAFGWWNSGGGTRRRLRKFVRRFKGVRRTAPAGAAS
ncbi:hypothetical protein [Streptomyces sp. STCH 565 A]|uniref:hypothetical protein n=1 Tax=Streptomyces sp. STCH 565 A TaxID=2950532 RepID=UPI002075E929|nr:hypothetical protein [Streptomyces sp. STCH 565 A]MCM8548937.1 hypothetical protein [Streptomyces sp. STCH 565 A]